MKGRMIVSTGGKGGTGKSTFAFLLAIKLYNDEEKVVLCDCEQSAPTIICC
jgi:MinD superfamily P-loop ATPase